MIYCEAGKYLPIPFGWLPNEVEGDPDEFFAIDNVQVILNGTNPVPEPTTMLLFGVGLIGFAGARRRKVKR